MKTELKQCHNHKAVFFHSNRSFQRGRSIELATQDFPTVFYHFICPYFGNAASGLWRSDHSSLTSGDPQEVHSSSSRQGSDRNVQVIPVFFHSSPWFSSVCSSLLGFVFTMDTLLEQETESKIFLNCSDHLRHFSLCHFPDVMSFDTKHKV